MSGFQVPFSSSPPSTPDRRSRNGNNKFSFGQSNPSTTPAGPPPSSAGSFTPAGPPPSSYYGSSTMESPAPMKSLSFSQQSFGSSPLQFNSPKTQQATGFMRPAAKAQRSNLSNEYQSSPQRDSQGSTYGIDEEDEEEYSDEDERPEEEYEDQDADAMTDDEPRYDDEMEDSQTGTPGRTTGSIQLGLNSPSQESSISELRQSREEPMDLGGTLGNSFSEPKSFMYTRVAKDLYGQMGSPMVAESDDVVVSTETIITKLYEEGVAADNDDALEHALMQIPLELTKVWSMYDKNTAVPSSEEYSARIGPGPRSSAFSKANFLAGLTLKIHHSADEDPRGFGYRTKPLPQIMLEWIDEYHNPYPSQLQDIQSHRPSPSHHKLFWDTILNGVLRGKVVAVVELLRNAGWRYARTGLDDIHDRSGQTGFSGLALANIEKVMQAACDVLQQCPAVQGDWDIRGSDWQLFRLRISQASEDLKRFAEGRDGNSRNSSDNAESFGFSTAAARSGTFSKTAQKAESRVPWHIYQNLLSLYGLVSGETGPIIENAQDWCEATVGLVVWWDEGKNDRRLALGRSHATYRASSRESDPQAYLKKLRRSFETVMASSSDFQVNTMSPLEVGLASVFEGDNESVIGFLRAWSGPISTAVAEIASLAGWLPHAEPRNLISMDSLDQEDLDLLGINPSPSKSDGVKDHTLITYARALSQRGTLKVSGPSGATAFKEGWELAIAVLGRLDSGPRSEEVVGDFLRQLPLDSSATVDKLWRLLNDLGMTSHAEATAQTYADLLAEDSHNYGEALWYYALSHKATKVKDVLDLLISISLIQSTAYPPESELDDHLKQLISSPQRALNEMSKMDFEAAKLLHKMISGYATLRRFYVLRDEEISGSGEKPKMGTKVRNREAVAALLAVITSSADNIRGGLYDEGRGAVVSVDFLLALLGEATVFVNQPKSSLSVSQIEILLKTIEDLQTVVSRVYDDCHEFFQTVLASAQGLKGSSPTDLLRKSTSNLSGSSQFSLVGSSMLASQLQRSIGSSGVLVKGNIKRGWDWRRGLSANTNGEDVLRILRLGLAKDLAKAWLLEADNRM